MAKVKTIRQTVVYLWELFVIAILFLLQVAMSGSIAYLFLRLTEYKFSYKAIFIGSFVIRLLALQLNEKELDNYTQNTVIYALFVFIALVIWAIIRTL